MTDKIDDIVIPILRSVQSDMSGVKSDIGMLKSDMAILKESVRRIDSRVSSIDSHMAGFHTKSRWQTEEIDDLRGRVEALEKEQEDANPDK